MARRCQSWLLISGMCLGSTSGLSAQVVSPRPATPVDVLRGGTTASSSARPVLRSTPSPAEPALRQVPVVPPESGDLPLILPPRAEGPGPESTPLLLSPTDGLTSVPMDGPVEEPEPPIVSPPASPDATGLPGRFSERLPGEREPARTTPSGRSTRTARVEDLEPSPPAQRQRRGLLGGLFGRTNNRVAPSARSSIEVLPPEPDLADDPSASEDDSARSRDERARRRIEAEIVRLAGDRIRELEVTVRDREVEVRATATRFYLRRGVRRSIEELPALRGYQTDVNVR